MNVTMLRSLYAITHPSVVCNVPAPYSAGWNFLQCFKVLKMSRLFCQNQDQDLMLKT